MSVSAHPAIFRSLPPKIFARSVAWKKVGVGGGWLGVGATMTIDHGYLVSRVREEKRHSKFSGFILQCYDRQLEQWSDIFGASSIVDIICIFFMTPVSCHRRHKSVDGESSNSNSNCSRQRSYCPRLRHMDIVEVLLHGKEEPRS